MRPTWICLRLGRTAHTHTISPSGKAWTLLLCSAISTNQRKLFHTLFFTAQGECGFFIDGVATRPYGVPHGGAENAATSPRLFIFSDETSAVDVTKNRKRRRENAEQLACPLHVWIFKGMSPCYCLLHSSYNYFSCDWLTKILRLIISIIDQLPNL